MYFARPRARPLLVGCACAAALALCSSAAAASGAETRPTADVVIAKRVERVLATTPLIDGHNDLPWALRLKSAQGGTDLAAGSSGAVGADGTAPPMTSIRRLRAGHVGGQFWSVWVPANPDSGVVQTTLEQIDLVKRMVARHPDDFEMAYTAADVRRIHKGGRIASLIGVEGGHQINDSLAVLRQYYDLGARYMTLTHSLSTGWADSATANPASDGLSPFGKQVVREMNRLGMLVDLSHVSPQTMSAALDVTLAPVIFSHSSSRALVDHPRNVPDEILRRVARNGGIVMINFYPGYVSAARYRWEADRAAEQTRLSAPPDSGLYVGQPDRARSAMADWVAAHPKPAATLSEVADHVEHVRVVAGGDCVGLGSDFDGISAVPAGLEAVDRFPALLAELMRRGWSDQDIAKLAGENVLRVLAAAEAISADLRKTQLPSTAGMEQFDAK